MGEDGTPIQRFQLQRGGKEVVTIGRAAKCDVVYKTANVSNNHIELRLLAPSGEGASVANGQPVQLGICDVSSNGTGLRPVGGEMLTLQKGVASIVPDGAFVEFPMKGKLKDGPRKTLTITFDAFSP